MVNSSKDQGNDQLNSQMVDLLNSLKWIESFDYLTIQLFNELTTNKLIDHLTI